jgi:manganese/zinc/iron transport system permease protein
MQDYFNPYQNQTLIGFLSTMMRRSWEFVTGKIGPENLASDEIQMIVLVSVAISAALVGAFMVLRRMTMLANSLSHTILLGIVVAFLITQYSFQGNFDGQTGHIAIQAMLIAALLTGLLTTFLTEWLIKVARLQEDASTGLIFTSLFALGIILVTVLTRSAHIGIEAVMGNADALQLEDCKLVLIILGFNILLFLLFFKEFAITTFDPALARSLGISATFFSYLLMIQASATVIGAFRAIGVLMVLGFMTGPVLAARLLTDDLKKMLGIAAMLGALASIIGVALTRDILTRYEMALSTGGVVICMTIILYALIALFTKLHVGKKSVLMEN